MSNTTGAGARRSVLERLAAGPISWGVCEVPGWGLQLPPERVLSEMHSLGIVATEAGPDGYLGYDAAATRALLDAQRLALVGGFLPLVLHDPTQLEAALEKVRRTASFYAELGAGAICSAAVVDESWAPRVPLDDEQWDHLLQSLHRVDDVAAEYDVRQVLHPHWGTLVQDDEEVRRVLAGSDVAICLDTGHLALGGSDPLEIATQFANRVAHVHLKDVQGSVAARLRSGELDLVGAVQAGLFQPLGAGDLPIDRVVLALERAGYAGWYVLEQDTAIMADAPAPGEGPVDDVRGSIEFLQAIHYDEDPVAAGTEGR